MRKIGAPLVLLMLCGALASVSVAQNTDFDAEAEPPFENRFRVGLDCSPVSEALQFHLNLDPGTGLIVTRVMDGSPADKVGLRRLDVIAFANDQPVGRIIELVRAVNQAGANPMELVVIRRGEEMRLEVTPEERDEEEIERIRRGFRRRLGDPTWNLGPLPPEIQQRLDQLPALEGFFNGDPAMGQRGFRRLLPGIVMDQWGNNPLPDGFNLNLQVERNNNGPAKIHIQKDGKTWEVTEDNLDELPEELRPIVRNMLNGGSDGWSGLMAPNPPGLRNPPRLRRPTPGPNNNGKQFQDRFDGLQLQLQELKDAIRSLKEDQE